jgi:hypothetical protein
MIRAAGVTATIGCASAAPAKTIVIFVEPMTLERHTEVFDTPGPDRLLMCTQPPSMSGCQLLPARRRD